PAFIRSDVDTGKLVGSFVAALGVPTAHGIERRMVVAVAGPQSNAAALAELTELARHMGEAAVAGEVGDGGRPRRALRSRFEDVRDLVAAVLQPDGDAGGTTWQLLQRLHVSMLRLEPPDEADWTSLLTELESWARVQTAEGAELLRAKLESLAAGYSPL